MKPPIRVYFAVIVIIAGVFLLIGTSLQGTMVYSVTVSDLKASGAKHQNRGVRVEGTVVPGSLISSEAPVYRFAVSSAGESMPVYYRGILPDTFKENHEVILEGRYRADRVFEASKLFTKCASKYDAGFEHPEFDTEKN